MDGRRRLAQPAEQHRETLDVTMLEFGIVGGDNGGKALATASWSDFNGTITLNGFNDTIDQVETDDESVQKT